MFCSISGLRNEPMGVCGRLRIRNGFAAQMEIDWCRPRPRRVAGRASSRAFFGSANFFLGRRILVETGGGVALGLPVSS